jgi:ABC-type transport system substrate-binding protein
VPHAAEIRFALIGTVGNPNVWALFDSHGYSYNNYAVRSSYWPRLYQLAIPDGSFEPQAAAGMPSPVQQEGAFYTATVPLRADLHWTDGSPFTAEDVAFTLNTAVAFQLGFDWHAYYDPSYLDHADALDTHTVKFFFKKAPNVAVWQYGALLGPVVQKAYWAPRLTSAASLLPTSSQLAQVETLETQVADQQKSINDLILRGSTASGESARQLQIELQSQQRNLDGLRNALAKAHEGVDGDMESARQALYSADAAGEPTLGTWLPAGGSNGTWTNAANPAHPFTSPNFDRAVYAAYPDEYSALNAFRDGHIDAILEQNGVSSYIVTAMYNGHIGFVNENDTSSAYFLVVNPASPAFYDPTARRALFCSIARVEFARQLDALPLVTFMPSESPWLVPSEPNICGEDNSLSFDPAQGVGILKSAGYSWTKEPKGIDDGIGLTQPDGQAFPQIRMLATSQQDTPQTTWAAKWVSEAAQHLGMPVNIQPASPADIRFALFNSHKYDMAVVGWRLSRYPGYLCDWFGDGNPFGYNLPQVRADCASLSTTTDLAAARQLFFDIQSVLSQDPPFIPLFSGVTYDATRGIVYPFDGVLNGLSGVYGAPDLAIPSP